MKTYENNSSGFRLFLEDTHAEMKMKYKAVSVPDFIEVVVKKLEEKGWKKNE